MTRRPPKDVLRLVDEARRACRRAGLKVPPLDVRAVRRLPKGRAGETETLPDGTVRIWLTPAGYSCDIVAHELAHAVLEPILEGRVTGHREAVPASLWGTVYAALYAALVE